jgi:TonB family protein
MKKQISFASILLASFFCIISYAEDNVANKDIAHKSSQVDTIPKVTHAVKPTFSLNSRIGLRGNELLEDVNEGRVVLRLVVTEDGSVRDPEVVKSTPPNVFDEIALKTIMEYRFRPAVKDGKPVDFIVSLPMEFKIPHKNASYAAYKARVNGRKYFKSGEYKKAIQAYTEAIKIDEKYSGYYSDRGRTYIELGEYKKALSDMNTAIKLTPDEGSYYTVRSDAYMKLKDTKNMCLDLKKACELGECSEFDSAKESGKCSL